MFPSASYKNETILETCRRLAAFAKLYQPFVRVLEVAPNSMPYMNSYSKFQGTLSVGFFIGAFLIT